MMSLSAAQIIEELGLTPHPESGHFRETFRDMRVDESGRAASTAIYFLLRRGERSRWHRVDAAEVWHWYAGAPLSLTIADATGERELRLGSDFRGGERPQAVAPAHAWQQAVCLGEWTLVGCTVAPGFDFNGFELVPEDAGPPFSAP